MLTVHDISGQNEKVILWTLPQWLEPIARRSIWTKNELHVKSIELGCNNYEVDWSRFDLALRASRRVVQQLLNDLRAQNARVLHDASTWNKQPRFPLSIEFIFKYLAESFRGSYLFYYNLFCIYSL